MTATTRHPDPDAIDRAIARIRETASHVPGPVLDMGEYRIYKSHCKTIACLAGWHLLSKAISSGQAIDTDEEGCLVHPRKRTSWTFTDGADDFARDLGFEDRNDLQEWAAAHPVLWGNAKGEHLFSLFQAYAGKNAGDKRDKTDAAPGKSPGNRALNAVLDHWEGVAGRIRALKSKP